MISKNLPDDIKLAEFKELLEDEYITIDCNRNRQMLDKAFEFAYQEGHSSGNMEIEGFYMDIAEIVNLAG